MKVLILGDKLHFIQVLLNERVNWFYLLKYLSICTVKNWYDWWNNKTTTCGMPHVSHVDLQELVFNSRNF